MILRIGRLCHIVCHPSGKKVWILLCGFLASAFVFRSVPLSTWAQSSKETSQSVEARFGPNFAKVHIGSAEWPTRQRRLCFHPHGPNRSEQRKTKFYFFCAPRSVRLLQRRCLQSLSSARTIGALHSPRNLAPIKNNKIRKFPYLTLFKKMLIFIQEYRTSISWRRAKSKLFYPEGGSWNSTSNSDGNCWVREFFWAPTNALYTFPADYHDIL